ncbi:hypothetical protein J3E72DRAFT_313999 [Bipolaris maydis]|nr:hypothetical protein BM1_02440 [Bipolaris maydis]KAJ5028298.1 hypothetical protein J3E73DRAFT_300172 [Bipolaris maydis]KAJ5063076.1 hypothetical protein J3E74DRAFT_327117 [Bipolaris maydis]KAJ6199348.1 hypothetical protein J3E72DRAFT_313999 [Bipolaris maydis]KAJ6204049.1 hypothetical protein PSV09DRAFT_2353167 [Bipolaris maydis]
MSSYPQLSPSGLPSSPRANRQMELLSPLDTSFTPSVSQTSSPYSSTSEKQTPKRVDIFADATIPLSPISTTSSMSKENPYAGLEPRKRSGLARLFSCLGREERARRRMNRSLEFEKVGDKCHWTEY